MKFPTYLHVHVFLCFLEDMVMFLRYRLASAYSSSWAAVGGEMGKAFGGGDPAAGVVRGRAEMLLGNVLGTETE